MRRIIPTDKRDPLDSGFHRDDEVKYPFLGRATVGYEWEITDRRARAITSLKDGIGI